jgi:hypothetical protein
MREGDAELGELRAAIRALADASAADVVAEARAEAFAKVRSMLSEAIARELLDRAPELLDPRPGKRAGARSSPRRRANAPSRPAVPPRRAAATPPPPEAGAERGAMGCYVYGVMRAPGEAAVEGIAGVDAEHPTRLIAHAGLAALVSDVSLAEFGEEPLLENLNDVGWLERTARAHERVLDEALARETVVPLRLCTIYHGEEQVREMLERERSALREALERLRGKTEWGVKVIAEPGVLEENIEEPGTGEEEPASAGRAYIETRRREARSGEQAEELAAAWADAIHEALASVAAEALRNPLQAPDLAGYEGEMLLNGVYLVDDASEERFRAAVEDQAARWSRRRVAVELTGPWPPYNFVKSSIEAAR